MRPPALCAPEREPGFPVEYVADPSKAVAVRMYADEVAFRHRIATLLERQLHRLEAIAEARLTTRSTDAQLALAILRTADLFLKITDRLRELTPDDPEEQMGAAFAKLDYLTKQLGKLRRQRHRGGVPTAAEILTEPQAVVSEPSPDDPETANP